MANFQPMLRGSSGVETLGEESRAQKIIWSLLCTPGWDDLKPNWFWLGNCV